MREATPWPHPLLTDELLLPSRANGAPQSSDTDSASSRQASSSDWLQFTGARHILIAPNLYEARRRLLRAFQLADNESVLLPPNATHALVEAMKSARVRIRFGELDADLRLCAPNDEPEQRAVWMQPPLGLPAIYDCRSEITVAEYGDTLPAGVEVLGLPPQRANVEIFGLHLSPDPRQSGALLTFADENLYRQLKLYSEVVETPLDAEAARQLIRLRTLAPRQLAAFDSVRIGLEEAAGLPMLTHDVMRALPHGVAVRVPPECSPALFWHYARGENTPVLWTLQVRPIHYAAVPSAETSIANLERWFAIPVSANEDPEADRLTVLGIVKTAEYLGVRWRMNPARARRYAALLDEMYGADHDGYRPAFAPDILPTGCSSGASEFALEDLQTLSCPASGMAP